MNGFLNHIAIRIFTAIGLLVPLCTVAQQTVVFDISTMYESKRVFLFNTLQNPDSLQLKNKAGKALPAENVYMTPYAHELLPELVLYESEGSLLCIDTAGNFYMRDATAENAKPIPLGMNITAMGLGKKNIVLETESGDLENLVVYGIPLDKYRLGMALDKVPNKLTFRIEEIIYGAKGKTPPRLLELWAEQIKFDPEDRKVMYEYNLLLPKDMVGRGKTTLMIYDLSKQVVAIYPNLNKTANIIKRDNIMSGTYIYKIFFNGEEEVKKGLIHYLNPETEAKEEEKKKQEEVEDAPADIPQNKEDGKEK